MNRKKIIIVILCLVLALALAGAVYAAVSYGSKDDPLIARSYLDEVLAPEIRAEMDAEIKAAMEQLENAESVSDFVPLSLDAGERLICGTGCEVLFRSGSAVSDGAFADTTAGAEIPAATAAEKNHLYMALEEGASFTAETEAVFMVKGAYSLA